MRIRITPGALLLLAAMLLEGDFLFLASVLAAAVHECGHLLAARLLGIRLRLLELDLMGAKLFPAKAIPSYRSEFLLAACGPLFSLLLALPIGGSSLPFFKAMHTATLSFALFNLLPIRGFDGGRMLAAPITAKWGAAAADRLLFLSTYASLLLLFSLSACLLLRYGESATLAVLSASLFAQLFLSFERTPQKPRI